MSTTPTTPPTSGGTAAPTAEQDTTTTARASATEPRPSFWAGRSELLMPALVLALAVWLTVETATMNVMGTSVPGPQFFPAGADPHFGAFPNGNHMGLPMTNGANGHVPPSESQLRPAVPEFNPGTATGFGSMAEDAAGQEAPHSNDMQQSSQPVTNGVGGSGHDSH